MEAEWSLFPVIKTWGTQKGFCAQEPHRVLLSINSTQSRNRGLLWYSKKSTRLWALRLFEGCVSTKWLCQPSLCYFFTWFQQVSYTVWMKRGPCEANIAVLDLVTSSEKADSLSFSWSHSSSPSNLFTQVLLPSFSHLSKKFWSGSLSKWNGIAFLNPNKLLHNLMYLISI